MNKKKLHISVGVFLSMICISASYATPTCQETIYRKIIIEDNKSMSIEKNKTLFDIVKKDTSQKKSNIKDFTLSLYKNNLISKSTVFEILEKNNISISQNKVKDKLFLYDIDKVTESKEKTVLSEYIGNKYKLEEEQAKEIVDLAYYNAKQKDISPLLILSLISAESSFKTSVKSSGGAIGIMQVIPYWHKEKISHLDDKNKIWDVEINMDIGSQIIKEYIDLEKGNLSRGLQRYNGALDNKEAPYAKKILANVNRLKTLISSIE